MAGTRSTSCCPVVVTCLTGFGAEALARRRFRDSFGRYVGRDVMEQVLAENPTLEGARREVSVLVSDLRGFTTLSETMPAERVAAHLNEYFPAMIDAIFAERGMINDFIGDGILAVFGAPPPGRRTTPGGRRGRPWACRRRSSG